MPTSATEYPSARDSTGAQKRSKATAARSLTARICPGSDNSGENSWLLPLEQSLVVGFFALLLFPLLYLARELDNNVLTSWQWTIARENFAFFFLAFCILVLTVFVVAKNIPLEKIGHPLLALLAFLVVVPMWIAPEMMLDSGRYFLQARYLTEHGLVAFIRQWGRGIWVWTDLPLSAILYGLVERYASSARLACQVFNTLLFSGAVLLTSAVGGLLWERRIGKTAGLLLLASPFLLSQAPQFLNDLHVMFFLVLYLYCLLRLQQDQGKIWHYFCPCSATLLFLSKYSVWPVIFLLPLLVLLAGYQKKMHHQPKTYWTCGATLLIIGGIFFVFREVFLAQIHLLRTYQADGLHSWRENYISTYLFQTHPFVTLTAGLGIVAALRRRDPKILVIAWFPFYALLLSMARSRYLIPFFPLLALLAAYGLEEVKEIVIRRQIVATAVLFSLLIAYGAYLPFFRETSMMNLKLAGEYLDTLDDNTFIVHTAPQHKSKGATRAAIPILALYTDKTLLLDDDLSPPDRLPAGFTYPLQFTQSMPLTSFSAAQEEDGRPSIFIGDETLAKDNRHSTGNGEAFSRRTGVFRYQTLVKISTTESPFPPGR
ncbi:MAG: glycosyltransferase family 39 protein [Deltaproteobacteria bacterium]